MILKISNKATHKIFYTDGLRDFKLAAELWTWYKSG